MAKALKLMNELIDLNDNLVMEMEIHAGESVDAQLDFLDAKIDKAIAEGDKRMISLLGIVMTFVMSELASDGWPAL